MNAANAKARLLIVITQILTPPPLPPLHADLFGLLSCDCCMRGPVCLPSCGSYADNARQASTAKPTLWNKSQHTHEDSTDNRKM